MQPVPQEGSVVRLRQRHYLVGEVVPGERDGDATRVRLSCLDDDAPGDPLEVLWELEAHPEVVPDEPALRTGSGRLDEPRVFGAWLNALRWECVTSTDRRLLQAPFRAGIDLKAYQLEPLRKALELPRVNLFIADDVGLGKTIEAGLIMQELVLRQRVDRVLVVAPPAVTLQWKEELEQRFGLPFALYDAAYVAERRRERGWGVNPWLTHPRFIVSTALLRGQRARKGRGGPRTPHLELLLSALGPRADRSLLILDEAHHAAPSSDSLYPVDSRTTRAIRQVAERFEHRLFLSATPHNGHSTSFSALLELLDPQRFTRGVRISGVAELEPVMVRRLKRDLRHEVDGLPERRLVDHTVRLAPDAPEVRLGHLLSRYDALYRGALAHLSEKEQAARGLVIVNLHKRLLSSVPAFAHTLRVHAASAEGALATSASRPVAQQTLPLGPRPSPPPPSGPAPDVPDPESGEDLAEEERAARDDEFVAAATVTPSADALALLREMLALAEPLKELPDARVHALAEWIRTHLCPGGAWNGRRVVVFTEYDHTLGWLQRTLPALLATGDLDRRIGRYHGGMGDAAREVLKKAFNTRPDAHPLRVLLATDAAREGINLQAHCSDLFHFDLPWNPARVEQRNGRIDRTLQPSPQVCCHYFHLPDRPEDRVLTYMVQKIDRIGKELGSLSDVLSARLAARMEQGIRGLSPEEVDRIATPGASHLEALRDLQGRDAEDAALLRGDLEVLARQLERSRRTMGYRVEHLRDAVDLGLRLAAGEGLQPVVPPTSPETFQLPPLDATWEGILAPLREPPPEDAPPWHRSPVKPMAFEAAHRLDADTVQLHLGHPLVKRLLARFRAQGFAAHDLSRVTVIEDPRDRVRRAIAFGRLVLFGHGATRLHEEIVSVAARVMDDGHPRPYAEDADRAAREALGDRLAAGPPLHPSRRIREAVLARAHGDFAHLWTPLRAQAREAEEGARSRLAERGEAEAEAMRDLLVRQREAILRTLESARQLELQLTPAMRDEREQFDRDRRHMERRLDRLEEEEGREVARIRRGYEVALRRFEPLGLVYLWPREGSP
ncbi:DISARM system SNF2-like helicase DrmD [Myxococcota bacterium]|nr:DISARM system SNF2-like helicase DrmD [Myxococcota bacterium]